MSSRMTPPNRNGGREAWSISSHYSPVTGVSDVSDGLSHMRTFPRACGVS